jgi:predicted  nucleic acid-binding Zn-ribbon protein
MTLSEILSETRRLLYRDSSCETNVAAVSNAGTRIIFDTEDPVLVAQLKDDIDDMQRDLDDMERRNSRLEDKNEYLQEELNKEREKTASLTKDMAAYKARCDGLVEIFQQSKADQERDFELGQRAMLERAVKAEKLCNLHN